MFQGSVILFLVGVFGVSVLGVAAEKPAVVPGEVLVQYRSGLGVLSAVRASVHQALGVQNIRKVRTLASAPDHELIQLRKQTSVAQAIASLKAQPSVLYAEPNYVLRAISVPNDTDFSKLWAMQNLGQNDPAGQAGVAGVDTGAIAAWEAGYTGSREIIVGVIDTGIEWTHPELADNLYTNPGEIAGDGIDNDQNGYVDDVHGWNFASGNANSSDDHNHGTHCAGTIGALGNNALGVVGVNWNVTLMPLKFLTASGSGTLAGAVEAIRYATTMHVNLTSNSWGGGGFSDIMKSAIEQARDAGILFVAAAGNDSTNTDRGSHYPSNYDVDNVISVGAHDNRGAIASFSNWGPTTVDLFAPGVNIWSTVRGGAFRSFSGTSMATPHVAGAAALLMARDRSLTYSQIKERLMRTVEPARPFRGKSISAGRLSLINLINDYAPPRNEPNPDAWLSVTAPITRQNPGHNVNEVFEIAHDGARFMRIRFESFNLENRHDTLTVSDSSGMALTLTGNRGAFTTDYLEGNRATLRLRTDDSVDSPGFVITGYDWQ